MKKLVRTAAIEERKHITTEKKDLQEKRTIMMEGVNRTLNYEEHKEEQDIKELDSVLDEKTKISLSKSPEDGIKAASSDSTCLIV